MYVARTGRTRKTRIAIAYLSIAQAPVTSGSDPPTGRVGLGLVASGRVAIKFQSSGGFGSVGSCPDRLQCDFLTTWCF